MCDPRATSGRIGMFAVCFEGGMCRALKGEQLPASLGRAKRAAGTAGGIFPAGAGAAAGVSAAAIAASPWVPRRQAVTARPSPAARCGGGAPGSTPAGDGGSHPAAPPGRDERGRVPLRERGEGRAGVQEGPPTPGERFLTLLL